MDDSRLRPTDPRHKWRNMIPIMRLTKTVSSICYRHPILGIDWVTTLRFITEVGRSSGLKWHGTEEEATERIFQRISPSDFVAAVWLMGTSPYLIIYAIKSRIKSSVDGAIGTHRKCNITLFEKMNENGSKKMNLGQKGFKDIWDWIGRIILEFKKSLILVYHATH